MRSRRIVAAVAGVTGAVVAHTLDVTGLLPFVHESVDVRTAMTPAATLCWLALAAALAAVTARRPATAGAAAALAIGGLPELAGRLGPGGLFGPAGLGGGPLPGVVAV